MTTSRCIAKKTFIRVWATRFAAARCVVGKQRLAILVTPLVERMKFLLLQSKVIHTDDTSIKMLQPGRGTTRTCKFWPYLGDWLHPYAVYDFTLSRERDGPQKFLAGFSGYLQADAYSGYDCIYAGEDVLEVACWIHARRYWHQALDNDPLRANMALGFIARLSQIETQLRKAYPQRNLQGERDFEAVVAARQQHSLPILSEFKTWLDRESEDGRILPKSPIRAAFTYTLNQWEALRRYTEAGYLSFENNVAERLVKISAIGRKNYLFVGSERWRSRCSGDVLVGQQCQGQRGRTIRLVARIYSLNFRTTAMVKPSLRSPPASR